MTQFVKGSFQPGAAFDFKAFEKAVAIQVRFLDNVLAVTLWPLPQQKAESDSKRRIGVGFTGLGNALAMLNLCYSSDEGRAMASKITETMRDAAYEASVALSIEKGPFPLFDAEKYLLKGTFASRLPLALKAKIAEHGIRNSHLLSIAPTGTVSLAFADNASNGIEPPFSLAYNRKKRMGDGTTQMYPVVDHGLRVYLSQISPEIAQPLLAAICNYQNVFFIENATSVSLVKDHLPIAMETALEMSAEDHLSMLKVVQPFIDTSISKCVVKGTRIMTNQGILKVEDLGDAVFADTFANPRENLQVLCPDGQWRKVTQHYYGGMKPTVTIRLENGQVVSASQTHRLKTVAGWTQMSELAVGDVIQVRRNALLSNVGGAPLNAPTFAANANDYTVPSKMDANLALFLGMLCADGHLHSQKGFIGLHKRNTEVGETFTHLAKTLFNAELKHTVDARTNVDCWHFHSRTLCEWIKSLIGYRSFDKHAPEAVLQGSPEEMKAFLVGITLDGYRVTQADRESTVLYEGRSEELARNAFSLLVALGYQPRLTDKNVNGYDYKAWGVRATGIDFCLQTHKNSAISAPNERVKIPKDLFTRELSSTSTSYYARRAWLHRELEVCRETTLLKNFPESEHDSDYIYFPITHITAGEDFVYDIEVEESHDYLIDGIVSHNTVNVPGDYPFEDFKAIYDKAWAYKLKGVSTYRPNAILGSVLSVGVEVKKEEAPAEVEALKDVNPFTVMIAKRPDNELESVTKKVPYSGPDGDNSLFVSISFAQVDGVHQGEPVTVNRPIEVFITASANGAPSEWIAAHARDLSLIARAGLPILAKALQNSREIISDKGRTRYGWYEKADGSKVPRFHGSDVACIAYALQEILIRKGLLDSEGDILPMSRMAQLSKEIEATKSTEQPVERRKSLSVGKRCPECGDHTLIKKDGCEFCTACGHTGSCG